MSTRVTLTIKPLSRKIKGTIVITRRKDIRHMNERQIPSTLKTLKDIVTTLRSMDIDILSVEPIQNGHQTRKKR